MFSRLRSDIRCILDRDPAARTTWEVLTCYPGLHAVVLHRPAHWCWHHGPFYHTRKDTPDKVDAEFLAEGVRSFEGAVHHFLAAPIEKFKERDATLWGADVEVISRGPDDPQALVKVALTDPGGKRLPQTDVTGTLFCDDFFAAPDIIVKTDAAGTAVLGFKDQLVGCRGKRYVHIAAGKDYPLVEKVRAIPSR